MAAFSYYEVNVPLYQSTLTQGKHAPGGRQLSRDGTHRGRVRSNEVLSLFISLSLSLSLSLPEDEIAAFPQR